MPGHGVVDEPGVGDGGVSVHGRSDEGEADLSRNWRKKEDPPRGPGDQTGQVPGGTDEDGEGKRPDEERLEAAQSSAGDGEEEVGRPGGEAGQG